MRPPSPGPTQLLCWPRPAWQATVSGLRLGWGSRPPQDRHPHGSTDHLPLPPDHGPGQVPLLPGASHGLRALGRHRSGPRLAVSALQSAPRCLPPAPPGSGPSPSLWGAFCPAALLAPPSDPAPAPTRPSPRGGRWRQRLGRQRGSPGASALLPESPWRPARARTASRASSSRLHLTHVAMSTHRPQGPGAEGQRGGSPSGAWGRRARSRGKGLGTASWAGVGQEGKDRPRGSRGPSPGSGQEIWDRGGDAHRENPTQVGEPRREGVGAGLRACGGHRFVWVWPP